ncbi:hypothetical protein BDD12DRAFT_878490 [Trichophaea hybrida]|nr:hypothetical protein BDD12DRAFT_878490 [Trichophaea hybrida]
MADEIEIDWVERIPWQYRDFGMLYNGETANALQPDQSYNHAIDFEDEEQSPWDPIYTFSEKELSVRQEYPKEMLDSGKSHPSKSPAPSLPTPRFLPLPFSLPATPTQPASSSPPYTPPPPPSPHGSQPSVAPHIGAPSPAPSYQQEGTSAPEIFTDKKVNNRKKQSFLFHNKRVCHTWSHLLEKPSVKQILFAMSTWQYKSQQWTACYERHHIDEDGNAGTFHIHLVGLITLNSKGNTVNIKNPRAFDLKINREIYHAELQPARSLADTWCYV